MPVTTAPQIGEHRIGLVGHVDPLEAARLAIELPEGRVLLIQVAEPRHECHEARTIGLVGEMPVKRLVVIPLAGRGELAAHEEQRLSGSRDHVGEQRAQRRELLPVVARHFLVE